MKVDISDDELYPYYYLEGGYKYIEVSDDNFQEVEGPYCTGEYELPDDFEERYRKFEKEFDQIQDILEAAHQVVHRKEAETVKKQEDAAYTKAQELIKGKTL